MQPFTTVSGKAAPMLAANIDTDVIMPKQFLKGIDRNGLDRGLFFDLRFLPSGEPNPAFDLIHSATLPATDDDAPLATMPGQLSPNEGTSLPK